jgi:hypothetical protein
MIDAPHGTVEVENPAEVLREEDGVFEVTSPYGHGSIPSSSIRFRNHCIDPVASIPTRTGKEKF